MTSTPLKAEGRKIIYPSVKHYTDGKLKGESLAFPLLEVSEWVKDPELVAASITGFLNATGYLEILHNDSDAIAPYRPMDNAPTDGTEICAIVSGEPARIKQMGGDWFIVRQGGQTSDRLCQIDPDAIYGWIPLPAQSTEQEATNANS